MASKDFSAVYAKARAAGLVAGGAVRPAPMVVSEASLFGGPVPGGKNWYVPEGACGFAWVSFKGNSEFGRWAKKAGVASKGYPSGLRIWVGEFNQSVDRKAACAEAIAKVLNENGISAYADSRMD